jgi:GNAT superfamily N-acetyltransferase
MRALMMKIWPKEKPKLNTEAGESAEIAARLGAEIAAQFGQRDETPFSILARSVEGELVGGLNGVVHWRWLYIRHLWVATTARGDGLGRRLIAAAEAQARSRNCVGVYIDTFDSRIALYYEGEGFSRAGEIVDFPPGGQRIYLSKTLS